MKPWASAGIALLFVCVAGCVRLSVPAPQVHAYLIDYPPPAIEGTPLPVVLRIAPFRVAAAYASDAIAYRTGDFETATYVTARWVANPANMIADLLARDFSSSGLYRAVQQGPSLVPSNYVLTATLEEIVEISAAPGYEAHLRLRMLLLRAGLAAAPVLERTYDVSHPCLGTSIASLVAAMSRAMETISSELQHDVYAAIVAQDQQSPTAAR